MSHSDRQRGTEPKAGESSTLTCQEDAAGGFFGWPAGCGVETLAPANVQPVSDYPGRSISELRPRRCRRRSANRGCVACLWRVLMSDSTKAIFLSYARDDAAAARRIAEALRSAGL